MAHTISVVIGAPSVAIANRFRVLAVFADKRIPTMSDVPTVKEAGYDVTGFTPSAGIVVPAKTPDAIVAKLEIACHTAAESEQYQLVTKRVGITGALESGPDYRKMVLERMQKVMPVLKAAGFQQPG